MLDDRRTPCARLRVLLLLANRKSAAPLGFAQAPHEILVRAL
jgi:hypothetical protein